MTCGLFTRNSHERLPQLGNIHLPKNYAHLKQFLLLIIRPVIVPEGMWNAKYCAENAVSCVKATSLPTRHVKLVGPLSFTRLRRELEVERVACTQKNIVVVHVNPND